ncbi:MAG: hypothetical protein GC190_19200 [Alphaproteobacteria bacterium]|nr:hypothetical protein [Alphaproteobacteria bacterium]
MLAALKRAIGEIGGFAATGRLLDITRMAVSQWKVCPAQHVLEIEKHSGISRHVLRPDLYGKPRKPSPVKGRRQRA